MRERLATLPIDEADIVGIAVAPIGGRPSSVPPPLNRKPSAPPPATTKASIPPAPVSHVAPRGSSAVFEPLPLGGAGLRPLCANLAELDDVDLGWGAPEEAEAPPVVPAQVVTAIAPVVRAVAPVTAPRLTMSDPTDLIFDGMYGLMFARSAGEAASMCAETLARALGARAVVIHTHDLLSGELRAIGAHGAGDFDIIGSAAASDDDLVASAVICNQRSVTMTFDGDLPRIAPKRLHAVGAPRSVVAAPAMSWGRCLAIIEVIDADERFAGRVADSATYVAEHFAQFLSAHAA